MAVVITGVGLAAAFPEWKEVVTNQPDVVTNIIAVVNEKAYPLYTGVAEETNRRYLEASAMLWEASYGRDMHNPGDTAANPYRRQATDQDRLKGSANRGPGWVLPAGVS